ASPGVQPAVPLCDLLCRRRAAGARGGVEAGGRGVGRAAGVRRRRAAGALLAGRGLPPEVRAPPAPRAAGRSRGVRRPDVRRLVRGGAAERVRLRLRYAGGPRSRASVPGAFAEGSALPRAAGGADRARVTPSRYGVGDERQRILPTS